MLRLIQNQWIWPSLTLTCLQAHVVALQELHKAMSRWICLFFNSISKFLNLSFYQNCRKIIVLRFWKGKTSNTTIVSSWWSKPVTQISWRKTAGSTYRYPGEGRGLRQCQDFVRRGAGKDRGALYFHSKIPPQIESCGELLQVGLNIARVAKAVQVSIWL